MPANKVVITYNVGAKITDNIYLKGDCSELYLVKGGNRLSLGSIAEAVTNAETLLRTLKEVRDELLKNGAI